MMPEGAGEIIPTDKIKDMSKQAIPFDDINKILGDMPKMMQTSMPDFSTLFDSMPDLASLLTEKLPDQTDFADLMPDMNSMFGDIMPDESTIADMMPDFDSMFNDLATISPLTSFESLKMPEVGPPPTAKPSNTSYDDFGNEIPATGPTVAEKEQMMTRAEPTDGATLSDLKEQLVQLNTAVMELISHSAQTAENSSATVRATKDLNGNLFA
jgi:hypothetical protein